MIEGQRHPVDDLESRGRTTRHVIVGAVIAAAIVVGLAATLLVDVTGRGGSGLSDAYDLDIEALAQFDPNLILYEESGSPIPTGFERSRGLAIDAQGRLYVAGDDAVTVFGSYGTVQRIIGVGPEARCVAVSEEGRIFVGLRDHVEVFDPAGKRLALWESLGDRAVLTSIALSGDNVFVADAGNEVVLRYSSEGEIVARIGRKDPERNIPGFVVPSPYFDLAVAPDGLLRVVNPERIRIEAYTFDGDLEFWWGANSIRIEDFCGCCNPSNFAMLSDGSYVTAEKGIIRVKLYDAEGVFVGVVAGPNQLVKGGAGRVFKNVNDAQASGFDVAVDADDRVYVLDTIENVVRVFVRE
jgi:hypothetical protein